MMSGNKEIYPVHVVDPGSTPQEPIRLQSAHLLQNILSPLSIHDFMTQDFRRNAVHIRGSSSSNNNNTRSGGTDNGNQKQQQVTGKEPQNRFQPIIGEGMYNLNTNELVRESSSDSVFVWLAAKTTSKNNNGDSKKRPVLVQSIELPDADTALALHQSTGAHALYCRAPPPVEQVLVSKLLRETGMGCGQYDPSGESMTSLARGEVEMFITSQAGGITDWHYDFQENFTLQLSGVKRWTLRKGTVTHPLRACTPHYKAPEVVENQLKAARLSAPEFVFDQPTVAGGATSSQQGFNAEGPTETVTLHPGDAFYFPAGMWHKIEVLEPGVSINVSLMATNYATVTCQALQHLLLQKDEWRQVLVHNPSAAASNNTNDNNALNVLEHLKGLLKELPGIIEEFEQKGGGAECILPPTLLNPPNFNGVEEEDDIADGDNGNQDNNDDDDEDERPTKKAKQEDKDKHMNDDTAGNESSEGSAGDEQEWDNVAVEDEGEEDNTIDACEFQYPGGFIRPKEWATEKYRIVRNPLASLIRMYDATEYYAEFVEGKDDESISKDKDLYVLNVNYAGVESHESSIRVVLRDDPDQRHLNTLYAAKSEKIVTEMCTDCPGLIDCLVYYGYYVWVPVSETKVESLRRL